MGFTFRVQGLKIAQKVAKSVGFAVFLSDSKPEPEWVGWTQRTAPFSMWGRTSKL